jgi:hypothetical protein
MYKDGSEAYAKSVGLPLDVLTTEANSQKGLTDIKAEVARTGGNVAFCIDPNDASDALPIAKTLEAAGVYFVTWWSKPADVKAWDYPHWVAHMAMDDCCCGDVHGDRAPQNSEQGQERSSRCRAPGRYSERPRWQGLQSVLAKIRCPTVSWNLRNGTKPGVQGDQSDAGCPY